MSVKYTLNEQSNYFLKKVLGCILLVLFLFRFRNNRIHRIPFSSRTLVHVFRSGNRIRGDLAENYYNLCMHLNISKFFQPETSRDQHGRLRTISRQEFPKECIFCLFQVNSIPFILFILLLGAE